MAPPESAMTVSPGERDDGPPALTLALDSAVRFTTARSDRSAAMVLSWAMMVAL